MNAFRFLRIEFPWWQGNWNFQKGIWNFCVETQVRHTVWSLHVIYTASNMALRILSQQVGSVTCASTNMFEHLYATLQLFESSRSHNWKQSLFLFRANVSRGVDVNLRSNRLLLFYHVYVLAADQCSGTCNWNVQLLSLSSLIDHRCSVACIKYSVVTIDR